MDSNVILEVKNLSVKIGKEEILKNVSFSVKEGEAIAILGPNGAGKTTLLKTIIGEYPYTGEIKIKKGAKIGFVPQRLSYIKDIPLTVGEFFNLKEINRKKILDVLKAVNFEESILEKSIGSLSSGQFQRVLIGFSLLKDPNLLLFDEPMEGVDIKGQKNIYEVLSNIKKTKKVGMLFVTHDLDIIYNFVDTCLCLNKEQICFGPPKAINYSTIEKLYGAKVKVYKHTHEF